MPEVRPKVLGVVDLAPITVRVAQKQANLVSVVALKIRLSHCLIKPSVDRRDRANRTDHIAPGLFDLCLRNILTGSVAIDRSLIERITEFNDDVVDTIGKGRRFDEPTEPFVLLLVSVRLAEEIAWTMACVASTGFTCPADSVAVRRFRTVVAFGPEVVEALTGALIENLPAGVRLRFPSFRTVLASSV
jgi:hypothetical protein